MASIPSNGTDPWGDQLREYLLELDGRVGGGSASVTTFGALGDNSADDTSAIQDAIDSLGASGGVVTFPPGTYRLTSALTLPSYVTLRGSGVTATVLKQTSTTENGIYGFNTILTGIQDLYIQGPGTGSGMGVKMVGDESSEAGIWTFYHIMRNVFVKGFGGDGIYFDDPVMCEFTSVTSKENGGAGFFMADNSDNGATSCSFNTCYAHNNVGNGFRLTQAFYCSFNACGSDRNANGYKFEYSAGISMNGCGAEKNTGDGVQIGVGTRGVVISAPWFNNGDEPGGGHIHVTGGADDVSIIGAREATGTTNTNWSLHVEAASTNVTVISSTFHSPMNLASGSTTFLPKINKRIWFNANQLSQGSMTAATVPTNMSGMDYISSADGATSHYFGFDFVVPDDYTSGPITVTLGYCTSVTTGNVAVQLNAVALTAGDDTTSAYTDSAIEAIGPSAAAYAYREATLAATVPTQGTIIAGRAVRAVVGLIRGNAADTLAGQIRILNVKLTYS